MTEPKADYIIETVTPPGEPVYCPQCHDTKGFVIPVDEVEILHVPGILVRGVYGICDKCGVEFRWTLSDRALSRLIESVRRLRE